jgi:hypothetical protein
MPVIAFMTEHAQLSSFASMIQPACIVLDLIQHLFVLAVLGIACGAYAELAKEKRHAWSESMDSYGFLWIPMDSCGFLWIPMDSYGFLWITSHRVWSFGARGGGNDIACSKVQCIPMDSCEFLWISMGSCEFLRIPISPYGYLLMPMYSFGFL